MAFMEVRTKDRTKKESAYLRDYAKNVTSQRGEDGVIEKIFEIIGTDNKWCVEFGAWDGKYSSNTWSLVNQKGWKGVYIEGDAEKFRDLKNNYKNKNDVELLNRYIELQGNNSLDNILKETPLPRDFDCLSVDVDGMDWHIWDSLSDYQPRFVIIEFNPSIPNDVSFIQDANPSLNHGASLHAMIELGKKKGYELVATTDWNAFFVIKELFGKFGIEDNDIDAMHSPVQYESKLFQLYDGTLVLGGCNRLLWCGLEINQNDIQVLPVNLRRFNG